MKLRFPVCWVVFNCTVVLSWGAVAPEWSFLEKDVRVKKSTAVRWTKRHEEVAEKFRSQGKLVTIELDAVTGTPSVVSSESGYLASSSIETLPPGQLGVETRKKRDRQLLKQFIDENISLFGYGSGQIDAANIVKEEFTSSGTHIVVFQQALAGIPVFGGSLKAGFTAKGELLRVGGGFTMRPGGASAAVNTTATIDAVTSIKIASETIGEPATVEEIKDLGDGRFSAPSLLRVKAQRAWLPINEEELRLCWEVVLAGKEGLRSCRVLVDANSGEILILNNLTSDVVDAQFRVFTSDSPTPLSPGWATPSGSQPSTVARQLVTPSINLTASPKGWIGYDGDTGDSTTGNNASALSAEIGATFVQGIGTPLSFDFPLDLTQEPTTYRDAAIANVFYWINWMHDRLFEFGFDEAANNFQQYNFAPGSYPYGDPVIAYIGSPHYINNARLQYFGNQVGDAPYLLLGTFNGPTPDRDNSLDTEVILHEYTHGMTSRLVGDGSGIENYGTEETSIGQPHGLDEGWADLFALSLLSQPADDVDGNYAFGAYSMYSAGGSFTQNYYYGIRRYPYSTNLGVNPLTFRDIMPTQAQSHATVPKTPLLTGEANEVHNVGEVWCSMLWGARANLIKKLGYNTGNNLILQLATDGMKLLTNNHPTFIDARNAILQADDALSGGANKVELWAAFAERGLGMGASGPNVDLSGGTAAESYVTVPPTTVDGGNASADAGQFVTADGTGCFYVAGYTTGASTGKDILVVKFDSIGREIWKRVWSGSNTTDEPCGIHWYDSTTLYVGGTSAKDFVVLKIDPATGQLSSSWADAGAGTGVRRYSFGASTLDQANAMTVNSTGEIFIAGATAGTNGINTFLTAKFAASGNVAWSKTYARGTGADASAGAAAIAVLGNKVYVTGTANDTVSPFQPDIVIVGYTDNSTSATQNWVNIYGPTAGFASIPKQIVASGTSVYVVGSSQKSGESGNYDIVTIKNNASTGARAWATRFDWPETSQEQAGGLVVDSSGNVYVSGASSRTLANGTYESGTILLKYGSTGVLSSTWATDGTHGVGVRLVSSSSVRSAVAPFTFQTIASGHGYLTGAAANAVRICKVSLLDGDLVSDNSISGINATAAQVDSVGNLFLGGYQSSADGGNVAVAKLFRNSLE